MYDIDFTKYTVDQLLALRHELDKQIVAREQAARVEALEKAREAAAAAGYKLEDLIHMPVVDTGARRGPKPGSTRGSVPPKYANPADPTQTWTGRGRTPAWFNEVLATGAGRDSMLIKA